MARARLNPREFRSDLMLELGRQILFAPTERQTEQLRRIERLHDEIDTDAFYPFAYLRFRVTGLRSRWSDDPELEDDGAMLLGEAVLHDLQRTILAICEHAPRAEPPGMRSPAEAAAELGVTVRTLHRYRRAGLRWRPAPGTPRPRVCIAPEAIAAWRRRAATRADVAAAFHRMPPAERDRILRDVADLPLAARTTAHRAAAAVASEHGRAVETVRRLILEHDRQTPRDRKLCPDQRGPITDRQRRFIQRAADRGVSLARIGERIGRSRATVHRVLRLARHARLAGLPRPHHVLPTFQREDAASVILRDEPLLILTPEDRAAIEMLVRSTELPAVWLAPPILPNAQHSLLIRLNYLRWRLEGIVAEMDPAKLTMREIEAGQHYAALAERVRARLVRSLNPHAVEIVHDLLTLQSTSPMHRRDLLPLAVEQSVEAVDLHDVRRGATLTAHLDRSLRRRLRAAVQSAPSRPGQARHRPTDAALARALRHVAASRQFQPEAWNDRRPVNHGPWELADAAGPR